MNALYGFRAECERRCRAGVSVWRALNSLFEFMPVGALIDGSILAVHGGLGANLTSLSQLRELPRPARVNLHLRNIEPDADARLLSDVLWSDPTESDELEGIQPNARGRNVVKFGPDRVSLTTPLPLLLLPTQPVTNQRLNLPAFKFGADRERPPTPFPPSLVQTQYSKPSPFHCQPRCETSAPTTAFSSSFGRTSACRTASSTLPKAV